MTTAPTRRKKKDWCRAPQPVGTISIRKSGKSRIRMIKVRLDGPKQNRWREYGRYLWEQNHGPVPAGKRIVHLDGNTLNDAIDNLGPVDPGDVLWIHCHSDDRKSEANYAACRVATAEMNRARREVRRGRGLLNRQQWYLVDHQRQIIVLTDCRSRIQAVRLAGHVGPLPRNGHIREVLASLPWDVRRGHELVDSPYPSYARKPLEELVP